MTCARCEKLADISDLSLPYVIHMCEGCGRKISLRNPGPHGIGFKAEKGDHLVVPAGLIQITANPLKGRMHFTRYGLGKFVEMIFTVDIISPESRADFGATIRSIVESNEAFFKNAEFLQGLDLEDPKNAEEVNKRIAANPGTHEHWGYMACILGAVAFNAIEQGNPSEAAWAMAASERFRALAIFKAQFEEAVFMGNSARRVVDLLRIWDANKENGDEGFWQIQLKENAFAISQLFSVPVTLIQDKAYVGGMTLDGKDARFLDFILSGGAANDAILMEIKTPTTKLLGARYRRNVYPPNADLSGAVVQVNDYCHSLRENIVQARKGGVELNTFNPRRIIIIGNYERELTEERKRTSFELFRGALTGVEVITFDEFFRKVERLAEIFSLMRKTHADGNVG